jgi:hypothetical protein
MVGVSKIEISQVNWKRQDALQNANGIALVNGKVSEQKQRTERAAFPKTKWNHTFARAFGSDPLNEKAQAENETATQANDLPGVDGNAKKLCLSKIMQPIHKAGTFRQIAKREQPFLCWRFFCGASFQLANDGLGKLETCPTSA